MSKNAKSELGIDIGDKYRRNIGGSMMEMAEVVEVGYDRMGIPHVRFTARLMHGDLRTQNTEERTLSLESFWARYKDKMLA